MDCRAACLSRGAPSTWWSCEQPAEAERSMLGAGLTSTEASGTAHPCLRCIRYRTLPSGITCGAWAKEKWPDLTCSEGELNQ
jgi:hypothetical protein